MRGDIWRVERNEPRTLNDNQGMRWGQGCEVAPSNLVVGTVLSGGIHKAIRHLASSNRMRLSMCNASLANTTENREAPQSRMLKVQRELGFRGKISFGVSRLIGSRDL